MRAAGMVEARSIVRITNSHAFGTISCIDTCVAARAGLSPCGNRDAARVPLASALSRNRRGACHWPPGPWCRRRRTRRRPPTQRDAQARRPHLDAASRSVRGSLRRGQGRRVRSDRDADADRCGRGRGRPRRLRLDRRRHPLGDERRALAFAVVERRSRRGRQERRRHGDLAAQRQGAGAPAWSCWCRPWSIRRRRTRMRGRARSR